MKSYLSNLWFRAKVAETRALGPTQIVYAFGARMMAVGRASDPYTPFRTPMLTPEDAKASIHGHDTGMRHKGCGGEIYYDWTVTYDYEGSTIPAARCTVCKQEILGDAEVVLPSEVEAFL